MLRIGDQGELPRACDGTICLAGILRTAKRVRCDDDSFCRDGPLIDDYIELLIWDPAARQFRRAR